MALFAWVVLAAWGQTPYAVFLGHGDPGEATLPVGADPSPALRLGLFVGGWVLMTVAMMLPASLPLLILFRWMVGRRRGRGWLLLALTVGYLAVWGLFGLLAYTGDRIVHAVVARAGLEAVATPVLFPIVLQVAGIYQFTGLKDRCLQACRSPYLFVAERWRGRRPAAEAVRLGIGHGLFCVGCCWTLMLLLFAVGVGHLVWMLGLGAVMAAERAAPWGRYVTRPVGATLIAWGCGAWPACSAPYPWRRRFEGSAASVLSVVEVANAPGGNSISVAEHTIASLLFLAKRMYAVDAARRRGRIGEPADLELAGKTLGIVGLVASVSELARIARAFGMRVIATNMHPSATAPGLALDIDSTEIPVYGQQEQSAYSGRFESTCYHPGRSEGYTEGKSGAKNGNPG